MSRFELDEALVDRISLAERYPGQVMFSTSISTSTAWQTIERGSDAPAKRLATLARFARRGIATNLMVKPFIPGITDKDSADIAKLMLNADIRVCVVGDLYLHDRIERSIRRAGELAGVELNIEESTRASGTYLDCAPSTSVDALHASSISSFIAELARHGVVSFMKSACASSYTSGQRLNLLAIPGFAKFCVSCGMCDPNDSHAAAGHTGSQI